MQLILPVNTVLRMRMDCLLFSTAEMLMGEMYRDLRTKKKDCESLDKMIGFIRGHSTLHWCGCKLGSCTLSVYNLKY